jgi:integrase
MLAAAQVVKGEITSWAPSIGEYGECVIDRWRGMGKKSWDDDASRSRKWVIEFADWASAPVDTITRGEIKEWARSLVTADSERSKPIANRTIKHIVALVRRIFAEAVEDELIETSPAIGFKTPKRSEAEEDHWTALTPEEIDRTLNHPLLSLEQRTAYAICIYAGLRQGECAALRHDDVRDLDGEAPHLMIRRSWDTTPKNGKIRRVDLIPAAVRWLREWMEHADGSASSCIWGHTYARGYDWGWRVKKDYANGVCMIGAKNIVGIKRTFWFHHLRDTCASNLLTGTWGRPWTIAEVATLLGHSTTWVTERYARVLPGHMAKATAATKLSAQTFHEPPTTIWADSLQAAEIIQHAQRDSPARPSERSSPGLHECLWACD